MKDKTVEILHEGKLRKLKSITKEAIWKAIKHNNGNLTDTAKALKISRTTIYRKLEKK